MPIKCSRREKGQSLVELASVFLLLILLLVGIVDLGSLFYTYTALRDTSQEGVIYGASNPTKTSDITSRILNSARFPIESTKITNITVTCNGNPCTTPTNVCEGSVCQMKDMPNVNSCQGKTITVKITYLYKAIIPLLPNTEITLNANVSETILQSKETINYLGKAACEPTS